MTKQITNGNRHTISDYNINHIFMDIVILANYIRIWLMRDYGIKNASISIHTEVAAGLSRTTYEAVTAIILDFQSTS